MEGRNKDGRRWMEGRNDGRRWRELRGVGQCVRVREVEGVASSVLKARKEFHRITNLNQV